MPSLMLGDPFAPDDITIPANTPTVLALVSKYRKYTILFVSSVGGATEKIVFTENKTGAATCALSGNFSGIAGQQVDITVHRRTTHLVFNSSSGAVVRVQGYQLARDEG